MAQVQRRPHGVGAPQKDHEAARPELEGEEALKKVTFCLVCGATSPVESKRCQNCDAPLADKRKRRKRAKAGLRITPLGVLIAVAVVALGVAVVVHLALG